MLVHEDVYVLRSCGPEEASPVSLEVASMEHWKRREDGKSQIPECHTSKAKRQATPMNHLLEPVLDVPFPTLREQLDVVPQQHEKVDMAMFHGHLLSRSFSLAGVKVLVRRLNSLFYSFFASKTK